MGNLNPKARKKNKKRQVIPIMLLGIISFLLIAYPYISNKSFEMATDSTISTLEKKVKDNESKYSEEIEAAREYNSRLTNYRVSLDAFSNTETENDGTDADYNDLLR